MATVFLGAVGTAVGGPFGGAIGSILGSYLDKRFILPALFPKDDPRGPRLGEFRLQTADEGSPMNMCFGEAVRVSGTVIWLSDLIPEKRTDSAGGFLGCGGEKTRKTKYSAHIAVGVCDRRIEAVEKIWADGKLIYTGRFGEPEVSFESSLIYGTIDIRRSFIDGTKKRTGTVSGNYSVGAKSFVAAIDTTKMTPRQGELFKVAPDGFEYVIQNVPVVSGGLATIEFEPGALQTFDNAEVITWMAAIQKERRLYIVSTDPEVDLAGQFDVTTGVRIKVGETVNVSGSVYPSNNGDFRVLGVGGFLSVDNTFLVGNAISVLNPFAVPFNVGTSVIALVQEAPTALSGIADDIRTYVGDETQVPDSLIESVEFEVASTGDRGIIFNGLVSVNGTTDTYTRASGSWFADGFTVGMLVSGSEFNTGANNVTNALILALTETAMTVDANLTTESSNKATIKVTGSIDNTPSYRGHAYVVFEKLLLSNFGNRIPNFEFLIRERTGRTVGQTIGLILAGADFTSSEFDVASVQDVLGGYAFKGVQEAAQVLQPMLLAYNLGAQERSGVLTFLKVTDSPLVTIADGDLGARADGDAAEQDPVAITQVHEINLPRELHVKYQDAERNYQVGDQVARSLNSRFNAVQTLDLQLSLTASDARKIAERILHVALAGRYEVEVDLPPSKIGLREQDALSFNAYAKAWKAFCLKLDRGENYLLKAQAVYEEPAAFIQSGDFDKNFGIPTGGSVPDVPGPGIMDLQFIDWAPLGPGRTNIGDGEFGFYMAASLYDPNQEFTSELLIESSDGGVTYRERGFLGFESVMGRAAGALGIGLPDTWDRGNKVTVFLQEGSLTSVSEAEVYAGRNLCIIGDEILAFSTATLVGTNTYELSNLLRGRRNTESKIDQHEIADRFILLDETNITFITVPQFAYLQTWRYKLVSPGVLPASEEPGGLAGATVNDPAEDHTVTAGALTCFSPTWVRGARNVSNDLTITWAYRSRALTRAFGPQATPLVESTEKYEVDILDTNGVVKRTISSTSPTASYTAAQQGDDGFTPGNSITVEVFQIGGVVRRGRGERKTI
jgi:hypothetical protein